MKIVHVIASLGMGGAETMLALLAERQAAAGHDVSIVMLLDKREVSVCGDVNVIAIGAAGRSWRSYLAAVWRLARTLRRLRADVVHAHMLHANLASRVIRLLLRHVLLINTVHAVHETGSVVLRLAYRFLDKLADVTVFVTNAAMDRYREEKLVSVERSVVIHNGIDLPKFREVAESRHSIRRRLGVAESDLVLTAIGRLTPDKDYGNLLNAFEIAARQESRIRLLVVGDGELASQLRMDVHESAVRDRVDFLGLRNDVPEILKATDLFVLSSIREGFGLVLAEAMASRVPVLSTRCGGAVEVVGDCATLVPIENAVALARGILRALGMPREQKLAQIERAEGRVSQLFSIDVAAKKWLELYGACMR